jgi:hypothetical protein
MTPRDIREDAKSFCRISPHSEVEREVVAFHYFSAPVTFVSQSEYARTHAAAARGTTTKTRGPLRPAAQSRGSKDTRLYLFRRSEKTSLNGWKRFRGGGATRFRTPSRRPLHRFASQRHASPTCRTHGTIRPVCGRRADKKSLRRPNRAEATR